ncbi:MAG: cell division protein FtsZ [Nitrospirota bacterium]
MFELEEVLNSKRQAARIKVVGVGGAGGNVINNMIASSIREVEFIAINTDAQALETSMAPYKVQIGRSITRGLGAGSKPEAGRDSALEDKDAIAEALDGADMVFITAGMGGGTGTGAAPVVAEMARNTGALTVAVVTKPFFYEGGKRALNAEYGLAELQGKVDTLIVIPNDRISMVVEKGTSLLQSFALINITGGLDLALSDVQEAAAPVFDCADEEANIIVGAVVDPDVNDEVRVTVIATGFKQEEASPVELPQVKKWTGIPREPSTTKGSDRVLAKSLELKAEELAKRHDPLDVPAFLRKSARPDVRSLVR